MSVNSIRHFPLEIIERFGGIRPMARKLDIPHSTVQGWKNRKNIPINHYDDILAKAAELDISLKISPAGEEVTRDQIIRQRAKRKKDERYWMKSRIRPFAGGMVVCAMIFGLFIMPDYIDLTPDPITTRQLNTTANADKNKNPLTKFFDGLETVGDNIRQLQDTTTTLTAAGHRAVTGDQPTGQRLAQLERDLQPAKGHYQAVDTLIAKLEAANRFVGVDGVDAGDGAGMKNDNKTRRLSMVERSVHEMNDRFANQQLSQPQMQTILARFQTDPNSPTGKMLHGIERQDLKAAAMLIGMTQLRDALNRSAPFEEDLQLLQKLAADNPDMQKSLAKLAPYSKSGVLTTAGIGGQVKKASGDMLAARIRGGDTSLQNQLDDQLAQIQQQNNPVPSNVANNAELNAIKRRIRDKLDNGNYASALEDLQVVTGPNGPDYGREVELQLTELMLAKQVGENIIYNIGHQIADTLGVRFVDGFTMPPNGYGLAPLD